MLDRSLASGMCGRGAHVDVKQVIQLILRAGALAATILRWSPGDRIAITPMDQSISDEWRMASSVLRFAFAVNVLLVCPGKPYRWRSCSNGRSDALWEYCVPRRRHPNITLQPDTRHHFTRRLAGNDSGGVQHLTETGIRNLTRCCVRPFPIQYLWAWAALRCGRIDRPVFVASARSCSSQR